MVEVERLTQLQDSINQQADYFCNSIGILQLYASSGKFLGFERSDSGTPEVDILNFVHHGVKKCTDNTQMFVTVIGHIAEKIDTLKETLPNDSSSTEVQIEALKKLEQNNKASAKRLEDMVRKGEAVLEKIQKAIADITQSQMEM